MAIFPKRHRPAQGFPHPSCFASPDPDSDDYPSLFQYVPHGRGVVPGALICDLSRRTREPDVLAQHRHLLLRLLHHGIAGEGVPSARSILSSSCSAMTFTFSVRTRSSQLGHPEESRPQGGQYTCPRASADQTGCNSVTGQQKTRAYCERTFDGGCALPGCGPALQRPRATHAAWMVGYTSS